jgi:2-hydroxychromene-2-carboxylate isomerase
MMAVLPFLPAKQRPTHPNDWMTTDTDIASLDSGLRRALPHHAPRQTHAAARRLQRRAAEAGLEAAFLDQILRPMALLAEERRAEQ